MSNATPGCHAILGAMGSRASRIMAAVILVTCLVCPLIELFDNWDHTIQTGNDTEYGLVVLALCVGVAYSFARFVFKSALLAFVANSFLTSRAQKPLSIGASSFALPLFDVTSPPLLSMRI